MTQKQAIKGLLTQAEHNAEAAKDMYKAGHYDWCLFLWHLVIEKTLKAIHLSEGQIPPYIHDLEKLIEGTKLEVDESTREDLKHITTFQLDARYDDEKLTFYKKATQDFAQKWSQKAEKIYQWLLKHV